MGSLNRIELIGNLGKQPEVRVLDGGTKVATFTLATTEPAYTTQQGKQVPAKTEWHNVVAWGGMATIAERYLAKGQQVYVEGKMRYRNYEDKDTHQKRYVAEVICSNIVLLSSNAATQADASATSQYQPIGGTYQQSNTIPPTGTSYGGYEQDNDPFPI